MFLIRKLRGLGKGCRFRFDVERDGIHLGLKTPYFDLVCVWKVLVTGREFRREERGYGLVSKGLVGEGLMGEEVCDC